jgi:hypothetical protein
MELAKVKEESIESKEIGIGDKQINISVALLKNRKRNVKN